MFNSLKLKYTVRNSKKTKLNKQKTHEVQLHVRVYTYDFRRSVVTDN
jgi:hypothetical protein